MVRRLSVDDRVHWTSQSGGFTTTKEGVVAAVISAGCTPAGTSRNGPYGASLRRLGTSVRTHTSYLIRVRRSTYYWPRVKHLKRGPAPKPAARENVAQTAITQLCRLHRKQNAGITAEQRRAIEVAIVALKEKLWMT